MRTWTDNIHDIKLVFISFLRAELLERTSLHRISCTLFHLSFYYKNFEFFTNMYLLSLAVKDFIFSSAIYFWQLKIPLELYILKSSDTFCKSLNNRKIVFIKFPSHQRVKSFSFSYHLLFDNQEHELHIIRYFRIHIWPVKSLLIILT